MQLNLRSLWLLICALVLMSVVAMAQENSDGEDALLNTEWQLVSFGDADAQTPVAENSQITLAFDAEESSAGGSGGCNTYSGSYALNGNALTFSQLFSTEMACMEPDLMTQEAAYFAALSAVTAYEIDGDRLTLTGAGGQQLTFAPIAKLADERWQLVSYGAADDQMPVLEGTEITLVFDGETGIGGSGGCNSYGGTYTLEGGTLTISELFSTLMACGDEITAQEIAYFAALQSTTGYAQTDDQLILFYGDGEQLVFEAVRTLEGALWTLSSFGSGDVVSSLVADSEITLMFDALNGSVGGSSGCNSYGGSYTVDGDSIRFSELVSTLRACVDNAVMAQESAYLAALEAVESYAISGTQLILSSGDGQQLIFDRAETEQPQ